jgi:hypothetical protein
MGRRGRTAAAVAVGLGVVVGSVACRPYDLDHDGTADFLYTDVAGDWVDLDNPGTVAWDSPVAFTVAVGGDYDGNAVWEPAGVGQDGRWHTGGSLGTIDNFLPVPVQLTDVGFTTIPVPGDYDGDGRDDPAWWDSATATWYVLGQEPFVFGRPLVWNKFPNDIPAPADYDGDGTDDPAVYQADTGEVHILDGAIVPTGVRRGLPAPADYNDGPGAEVSVFAQGGTCHPMRWMVEGQEVASPWTFPASEIAVPLPADHDGDGHADFAVGHDSLFSMGFRNWVAVGEPERSIPGGYILGHVTMSPSTRLWWRYAIQAGSVLC